MSTINLYDVLNVEPDCSTKEIKSQYNKLAKQYHPDAPNGDSEMFQFISDAYKILSNKGSRMEYDDFYALSKQSESDHFNLKDKSASFNKIQSKDISKKDKELQKKEFDRAFEEMDRKRGYKRDIDDNEIPIKDASRMLDDLELMRRQDEIEAVQEKIFDGPVPMDKFNAAFDEMYGGLDQLIQHTGNPDAWNTVGKGCSGFTSLDNYDDIYDESENNTMYSGLNIDAMKKKITKDDVANILGASYTEGHKHIEADYEETIAQRLKERQLRDEEFENLRFDEYATDSYGGYGISEDIGITNIEGLEWNNDDDVKKVYKKLLDSRK